MPDLFQEEQVQETSDNEETYGNQFLNTVDEADREVVGKYINDWDAGVTKKFQEYSSKLKEYEELGEAESLHSASTVLRDIQSDPVAFFNNYKDYIIENAQAIQEQYGIEDIHEAIGIAKQMIEEEIDPSGLPENQPMNSAMQEKFDAMEARLAESDTKFESLNSGIREKEQSQFLDNELKTLHTEHGQFDDTFVLTQLANGKTTSQAIEAWNTMKQSIIDSHKKTPPPSLLNGPAGTPLDQVDSTKLNDAKTRKEIGVQLLSSLNN
jgi:hypothetical protein